MDFLKKTTARFLTGSEQWFFFGFIGEFLCEVRKALEIQKALRKKILVLLILQLITR